MTQKTCLLMVMIVSLWAVPCRSANDAMPGGDLREKAALVHRAEFVLDAPLVVWNKLLDHLSLTGKLWNLYNFQPAYEITAAGKGVKVVDPSGINVEMIIIDASTTSRTFYCRGSVDHWAVPSFIRAEGVFVFRHVEEDGQRVRGKFEVFLRGENEVADFLLKLAAGKLKNRLQSRFTNNLEDIKKIVFDLLNHPDQVRNRLTGAALKEFNELFSLNKRERHPKIYGELYS